MRRVRVSITGALLAAMTLAACAPGPPVTELEAVDAPAAQVQANSTTVEVLITELYAHFLAETEEISPQYISAEATPGVAAAELDEAIGLGPQAERFVIAAATELDRMAGATTTAGDITEVDIELRDAEVLGSHDGLVVVATTLLQRTISLHGPITEQAVTYAVGWDGDQLASIEAVIEEGAMRGLDSGSGLSSPIGAVQRFADLAEHQDYEAIEELSDGENVDETQLDVLASVIASAHGTHIVALPQETFGSTHVVYLLNAADMVIGRFEVALGEETVVVYYPTA